MAEVKVEKQNQQQNTPSTAIQTSGQSGQSGVGLQRRGSYFPSLFSLSPRDFFTASPFELMRRFTEEMDRAFEDWGLARGTRFGETALWSPAVEVFERDNNLIVRAELPGLSRDDVKVEMTDEGLIIQGERKREHEEKGEGFYRSERSYGQFYRLIPLPEGANADQTRAQFENGILEVSVPVPESQRRRRSIPIETGSGQTEQSQTAGGSNKK
ncbi:MAG TPA: Hsp20/alpha crystallin family protein [Blastocatellia bacterium]|nr:Hsp20/alpha crystallin family protein [Blastocatellia bacterium]